MKVMDKRMGRDMHGVEETLDTGAVYSSTATALCLRLDGVEGMGRPATGTARTFDVGKERDGDGYPNVYWRRARYLQAW